MGRVIISSGKGAGCSPLMAYFKDLVLETFIKQNTLGLSADKLIEAKEINIEVLEIRQVLIKIYPHGV